MFSMIDRSRCVHVIIVYGMEQLNDDMGYVDVAEVTHLFSRLRENNVDLMVGLINACLYPTIIASQIIS